ncbi:MAG TPA: SCO family protein [Rubrivivax sp.]|nr:SCO family protein [Rubrivivax sp.]
MRHCAEFPSLAQALRHLRAIALGLLIGACTLAAQAAAPPALDERAALAAGEAAIGRSVPDYVLLDRQGRELKLSRYRGKPLLVSFIYTGCFEVCPATTRALQEAVKGLDKLLAPDQFNVVSIGFNQPFDTPTAMRAFAAQHRIDYANWEFLSPPPQVVEALARDFGFSYVATAGGFDHVLGVTLVDAQGRIHAQVYGDRMNAQRIGEPLRQLLTEGPGTDSLRLTDVIERVRILCTVYDPDTGTYRYKWGLIFELIGGIGFFLSVAVYFIVERRNRRRQHGALLPQ